MRDGSIKLFKRLPMADDVLEALVSHDGAAYYWYTTAFEWSCILPEYTQHAPTRINASEVPEIIKLATMLE